MQQLLANNTGVVVGATVGGVVGTPTMLVLIVSLLHIEFC